VLGEVLAYLVGRSVGRAQQAPRREPRDLTPADVVAGLALALLFVVCAIVLLIAT